MMAAAGQPRSCASAAARALAWVSSPDRKTVVGASASGLVMTDVFAVLRALTTVTAGNAFRGSSARLESG